MTYIDRLHSRVRAALELEADFVVHSFRHTMLTRRGEAGVDAFTVMRIAGHNSITVSQRYVHPSPEAMERAIERLEQGCEAQGRHKSSTTPGVANADISGKLLQ